VSQSLWVSAIFDAAGGILVLVTLFLTLRAAIRASSPKVWASVYARETYVSFAWRELGRALFLGYLFALGLSPMSAAFLLGQEPFWSSFALLSLIVWGVGTSVAFFLQLLPGFLGYVRYQQVNGTRVGASLYGQVLVVMALTGVLAWAFIWLLLPPALAFFQVVLNYLYDSWQLLTRILPWI
jgi:hypothetical protein